LGFDSNVLSLDLVYHLLLILYQLLVLSSLLVELLDLKGLLVNALLLLSDKMIFLTEKSRKILDQLAVQDAKRFELVDLDIKVFDFFSHVVIDLNRLLVPLMLRYKCFYFLLVICVAPLEVPNLALVQLVFFLEH
jgi:hypothetical protein